MADPSAAAPAQPQAPSQPTTQPTTAPIAGMMSGTQPMMMSLPAGFTPMTFGQPGAPACTLIYCSRQTHVKLLFDQY
jgi:hypothetical protein